jgi:hypothetical protein
MRLSGRNALAQDMEGWTNTRRWYRGAWRQYQTETFIRREEGLNEHGEAPPLYRPKDEGTVTRDPATGLSIPLSTLSSEQVDAGRPPEYRETVNQDGEGSARSDTTDSHANRPATSGPPPRSSITDLIHDQNERGATT